MCCIALICDNTKRIDCVRVKSDAADGPRCVRCTSSRLPLISREISRFTARNTRRMQPVYICRVAEIIVAANARARCSCYWFILFICLRLIVLLVVEYLDSEAVCTFICANGVCVCCRSCKLHKVSTLLTDFEELLSGFVSYYRSSCVLREKVATAN